MVLISVDPLVAPLIGSSILRGLPEGVIGLNFKDIIKYLDSMSTT